MVAEAPRGGGAGADERSYFRIRPTEAPIDATTVDQHIRRLHTLETVTGRGWRQKRRPVTTEWLLISTGGPDPRIDYYVGVEEPHGGTLERVLRGLFPDTYEIEAAEPGLAVATGGGPESEVAAPRDGRREWPGEPLAAVEFYGRGERPRDWQTQLQAFATFVGSSRTAVARTRGQGVAGRRLDTTDHHSGQHAARGTRRVPLSSVVETIAASPFPVVYQVLCEPKADWSAEREERLFRLKTNEDTRGGRLANYLFGMPDPIADEDLVESERQRVEELRDRDTRTSFVVNARALVVAPPPSPATTDGGTTSAQPLEETTATAEPAADGETDARESESESESERASTAAHVADTAAHGVETGTLAPDAVADELASALDGLSYTSYRIEGRVSTGRDAARVKRDLNEWTVQPPNWTGLKAGLTLSASRSRGIVADASEMPGFCLLVGAGLTAAGTRAFRTTPGERTRQPEPPSDQLERYYHPGLTLGRPVRHDGSDVSPIALPAALQTMHVAWFGKTGSGKSTGLTTAVLDNHEATDGASLLIDRKGDGMVETYLRAHYARFGSLDDVYHFDCAEVLPAFSFFDIRDELAAGVPRTTAVEDRVDHYLEILIQLMGRERFEQAVRSPDIIRYLVKALFDPLHGTDAFTHRDLHNAVRRMHERQSPPAVSDEDLAEMLGGVAANRLQTFDDLMQGVANRIEKIPVDERLARIFNHVAPEGAFETESETETETETNAETATASASTTGHPAATPSTPQHVAPAFDLANLLDENVVIIFDTGGLRPATQRALALIILSNLWTALRRRTRRDPFADHPLVNLYLEEAATVAGSELFKELLAQARSFGLSVTLAMQFPAQLRERDPAAYDEVLNNVSTFVTGNVAVDHRLAERLATDDMPPAAVANRLRALSRGEWLVKLPAGFDQPEPRPFLVRSMELPPGHPDHPDQRALRMAAELDAPTPSDGLASDDPTRAPRFSSDAERYRRQELLFDAASLLSKSRTRERFGLGLEQPSRAPHRDDHDGSTETEAAAPGHAGATPRELPDRIDSALPYTRRLPSTVEYDADIHGLRCTRCDARYDPSIDGMRRTIECCSSLDAVDPADIPICDLNLKLTAAERLDSGYSEAQLRFLQAVYNAQQRRYDPLEYDLLSDSMLRLQEYVDIETEAIDGLLDDGLLRHDTDHPHRLYTVTPAGRDVIGERYRQGVDYGHGVGDLEESTLHVLAVEVGRRYLEQEYAANPDSPVVEVRSYYDIRHAAEIGEPAPTEADDEESQQRSTETDNDERSQRRYRLDVAGLDAEGRIVVAVEAERVNHDLRRAAPDDFDKMAACGVEEAIWVVMTQGEGHAVLNALCDPLDGEPRVTKTYANTTPPQQFRIETPGLTAMYPVEWLRDRLQEYRDQP